MDTVRATQATAMTTVVHHAALQVTAAQTLVVDAAGVVSNGKY